jgi:glutamyl-Q tRNA(Asp) synthetase
VAIAYRGRFAPSPTGSLHFGSLVAALGSFLDARAQGGVWLVRMEDLDPTREVPGAAEQILCDLEAFGLEWDERVEYQSTRGSVYREALARLQGHGLVYACGCSRREIRQNSRLGAEGPIYSGTCRNGLPPGCNSHSLRLRTRPGPIILEDRFQGTLQQDLELEVGDFVIRRADGLFAYQLAVVLDDAWQGITQVMRGADLLLSTPRQMYLQDLLGLPRPAYAHLPLAVDAEGRKLSKQLASQPVDPDRPAPALHAALSHLGQPLPEPRMDRPREILDWALAHWEPARVPRRRTLAAGSP